MSVLLGEVSAYGMIKIEHLCVVGTTTKGLLRVVV